MPPARYTPPRASVAKAYQDPVDQQMAFADTLRKRAASAPDFVRKHVDVDDNLFEVGASSLTLIQIHEKIDELFPGQVDLTELFDFPTVSQLAKHLEAKLSAGA